MRTFVAILLLVFAGISLRGLTEKEYEEAKDEYYYQKLVMDRQFQAQYNQYLNAKQRAQCSQCYPPAPNESQLALVESHWVMWQALAHEQYSLINKKWQEVEKNYSATQQKRLADDSWQLDPSQDQFFLYDTRGRDKKQKEKLFSLHKLQGTLKRHPGAKSLKNHKRALAKLQKKFKLEEATPETLETYENGVPSTEQAMPSTIKSPQVCTEQPQFCREEHRQNLATKPQIKGVPPKSKPYTDRRERQSPPDPLTVAACAAMYFNGQWW